MRHSIVDDSVLDIENGAAYFYLSKCGKIFVLAGDDGDSIMPIESYWRLCGVKDLIIVALSESSINASMHLLFNAFDGLARF